MCVNCFVLTHTFRIETKHCWCGAQYGGALALLHTAAASLEDCEFTGNNATRKDGGAVYTERDIVIGGLTACRFAANSAGRNGGAIFYSNNPNTLTLNFLAFERNRAERGGALYLAYVRPPLPHLNFQFGVWHRNPNQP
jgi:predicted outer membrane repeat protein